MVTRTSRESYRKLKPTLGRKQQQVYGVIVKYGPISNRQIVKQLNRIPGEKWEVNSVTPRVKELRDADMVIDAGLGWDKETKRSCTLWAAQDQLRMW